MVWTTKLVFSGNHTKICTSLIAGEEKWETAKCTVQIAQIAIWLRDRREKKESANRREWKPVKRPGAKESRQDLQAHNALIIQYWEQE